MRAEVSNSQFHSFLHSIIQPITAILLQIIAAQAEAANATLNDAAFNVRLPGALH